MSSTDDIGEAMTERHGRLLAAFAERCARLTEDLADRALATEDAAEAAALAQAFHAVGRSLRQAIALEQRLEREAARARRQAVSDARTDRAERRADRKTQAATALNRLVWTEYERMEGFNPAQLVRELVDDGAATDPRFTEDPVETVIQRLEADLRQILDKCVAYQAFDDKDGDDHDPNSSPLGGGGPPNSRPAARRGSAQTSPPAPAPALADST